MNKNYSIPLDFSSLIAEYPEPIPMCSELQSIDSHLELLLTTCPGEHKFNPEWGCKIWDLDFEVITSQIRWETNCAEMITEMVKKQEQRLKEANVVVKICEITREESVFQTPAIRKRVDIIINAILNSTGEYCRFYFQLYLGPITSE